MRGVRRGSGVRGVRSERGQELEGSGVRGVRSERGQE